MCFAFYQNQDVQYKSAFQTKSLILSFTKNVLQIRLFSYFIECFVPGGNEYIISSTSHISQSSFLVFLNRIQFSRNFSRKLYFFSSAYAYRNSAITYALAERGYNITYISPDADKNPPSNLHQIHIENLYDDFHTEFMKGLVQSKEDVNPIKAAVNLEYAFVDMCNSKFDQ